MGCCFSGPSEESSPLLGEPAGRVRTDSVPQVSQPTGFLNENYRYVDKPAQTARRFRSPDSPVTAKRNIKEVKMTHIGIREVDKRLEDHAVLYNTQVLRWQQLDGAMKEMANMLPGVNTSNNLQDLFYHIRTKLADNEEALASIVIKRRFQYCMEIQYDDKLIDYTITPAFLAFNQANKLVKEILEKGPPMVSSIQLVIKDEKNLRREVLVASLGADGPDCLKACIENISDLRRAIEFLDDIKRESLARFEELKAAATPLTTMTH